MVATSVDLLLGGCAMLIVLMLSSHKGLRQIEALVIAEPGRIPEDLARAIMMALLAGAFLPFVFAIQVARFGATPGKVLMSLTVRNVTNGSFPGYPRALGRELLRFACITPLLLLAELQVLVAALAAGILIDTSRTRLSQSWYDRITRTVIVGVVREPAD
jgi:hypothetical protein